MISFTYQNFTLNLPSPKIGDQQSIKLRTKIYRSVDGTLFSYISTPNQIVLHLVFGNLNRPKILEVIAFLRNTAGKSAIIYRDYNDDLWKGTILTQPFETTHVAPRNNSFNLEFECVAYG